MRLQPSRIGVSCIPGAVAVVLAGCASAPSQEPRSAPLSSSSKPRDPSDISNDLRKFDVRSKDGNVIFKLGDLHCTAPGHPSHKKYGDCKGIPVVVLENPIQNDCIAVHPYANLIIHSQRERTQIVWEIFGASYYEFDRSIDGVAISKVTGTTDPTAPSDNYDRKEHQGRKWKWELRESALYPKTFYHLPNVVNTQTGKPCVPIDPGMINVVT